MAETIDITFVLRGQRFTLPLISDQFTGIATFIGLYNFRMHLRNIIREKDVRGAEVDLYIAKEGYPTDDEIEMWWGTEDIEANITIFASDGIKILEYSEWNQLNLQGFITAAQWLGVDWHNYVQRITINDLPAEVL